MKTVVSIVLVCICCMAFTCNKKEPANPPATDCFKGKLVRKGICMNYTISVIGNIDTTLVQAQWHEPNTNNHFTNAFRLGSPCSFPASLNEGDEFYFKIVSTTDQNCVVCQAYYPTPDRSLNIKVVEGCQ
jgi:hypothetical protein